MRRSLPAAAVTAAFLLVGGCTDSAGTEPPAPESRSTPSTDEPGRPAGTAQPPELEVPGDTRTLVAETAGTGPEHLPEFTPTESAYTVYVSCSGKGRVTLVDRDGQGRPHPIACDGVPTTGVIHIDDKEPQRLAIRVTDGPAAWRIAVVSGDQQL